MAYLIDHTSFSFGAIELVTLIGMICIIVIAVIKLKKLKYTKETLEEQVSSVIAKDTMVIAEEQRRNKYRNPEQTQKT